MIEFFTSLDEWAKSAFINTPLAFIIWVLVRYVIYLHDQMWKGAQKRQELYDKVAISALGQKHDG